MESWFLYLLTSPLATLTKAYSSLVVEGQWRLPQPLRLSLTLIREHWWQDWWGLVGAHHQCPLGSVASYLIYADVRTFRWLIIMTGHVRCLAWDNTPLTAEPNSTKLISEYHSTHTCHVSATGRGGVYTVKVTVHALTLPSLLSLPFLPT